MDKRESGLYRINNIRLFSLFPPVYDYLLFLNMQTVLKYGRLSLRVVFVWIINALGILLVAGLLPGVSLKDWFSALGAAVGIGLLNALLWPLFIRFALPLTVATVGLAGLVFNGIIIILTAKILPGLTVDNIWWAMAMAVGVTIINTITHQMLAIDDADTYYRNVIKRLAKRHATHIQTKIPGVLFLQIDGLAYDILQRAIRNGDAPTLSRWITSGTHRLEHWETDWTSQTGASQAGLLMGSNNNIPAFRWYEKDTGKTRSSGNPEDLANTEHRLSTAKGLLFHDGASRGNLYSGNAEYTLLTLSSLMKRHGKSFGRDYYAYFANPYNFIRTVILMITDIVREIRDAIDQQRRKVWPRLDKRGKFYPFMRSFTTIVQRDIVVQTLIADMFEGRSVAYADFTGYDEVSHHSGIERHETLSVLRDIDQQIARLEQAAKEAPRPYYLVVLSDHGQTQGATFLQRTGYSLDDFIQRLCRGEKITSEMVNNESLSYFNAAVTEAASADNFAGRTLHFAAKKQEKNGSVTNGQKKSIRKNKSVGNGDIKVLASGCLGLVYFTQFKHRLTMEEMNIHYPGLLDELRKHPYIGFLLVDSKKYGGIVLGSHGKYFLNDNHVEGKNPLLPFGKNAALHVKHMNTFTYTADIMINSFYDEKNDEVAAFEELIGSHGGMGGNQSFPFILFPKKWNFLENPVMGAANLHKIMCQWLADIGQTAYTTT